ncbi:MAG: hypothetical protein EAZ87_12770 [Nostocales cyanobacterium]|nr:MAG: hypothetical protein EAZ87_12770 [Nostocales cyanobacterium]
MNDISIDKIHPLLDELSDLEQQLITGGQDFSMIGNTEFFLQKTDIETTADNHLQTGNNESNSQNTKYNLSQLTIGFSFTFGFPKMSFPVFPQHPREVTNLLTNFFTKLIE